MSSTIVDAPRTAESLTSTTLTPGLEPHQLDTRLRRAARMADVGNRMLAFYLADMQLRGVHQALGMPTTTAYATRMLGLPRRTARELLSTGLRLRDLPEIDAAFREGRVGWSRVRRISTVATPTTESAWLEFALRTNHAELDDRVRRARPGDTPPSVGDGGLPAETFSIHCRLDAIRYEMWENARAKLRAEIGSGNVDDIPDEDLLFELLEMFLRSDSDGSVPGRKAVDGAPYRVVVARAASDAEEPGSPSPKLMTADGPKTIDEASAALAESDAATPPALRAKVLTRDNHACANCSSRRSLHAHHIEWLSRGGATTLENLVTLCARCHGLIHHGWLDVEVAQCATGGSRFEFFDSNGSRIHRRLIVGEPLNLDIEPDTLERCRPLRESSGALRS